ncbi:hypothetical protein L596_011457 [Steinernema carpocapsae]|uniref:Uncharacterized protein n=1 Tax=Steinernema carpocapsae TaxID=34508 RepID=A0A4U5NTY0_STECR|nr:hypothetical protein L596_011457 [Steinernema carpocapsae]
MNRSHITTLSPTIRQVQPQLRVLMSLHLRLTISAIEQISEFSSSLLHNLFSFKFVNPSDPIHHHDSLNGQTF